MKKICLTLVAASAILFSAQTMTAQETAPQLIPVEETVQQKSEFAKIEISELPEAVKKAVERDYASATISEAHVKEKEGTKKFKIVLATEGGEQKELYADAEGKWIEKDHKKKDEEKI